MNKTIKCGLVKALLSLCLICAVFTLVTACKGEDWNIAADSSSSVSAKLVKSGDGYTLRISGKGAMKDFTTEKDVPWQDKANEITSVLIGNEVETIGANAFAGLSVESIVVPESISRVGANAVGEKGALFVYNEEIEYVDSELKNIYVYSEDMPASADRYWQSDKSKGDIFETQEELAAADKNYWHFSEDGTEEKWNKIKILFIGNSFTYRNGVLEYSSGVPGVFDCAAEDLGYYVETYSITGPGWELSKHATATDTCGKQVEKLLNAKNDFDYVVLQEQSTKPYKNYDGFLSGVKEMQKKIEKTQDHAQIYLYETWGSPYSANEDKTTVPEMELKLLKSYNDAAKECGLKVSYVGRAFTYIYENYSSVYLWDTDNRHQGYKGAYLSGLTHVGTILGADVRNTKFVRDEKYGAPLLDDETVVALREAAYKASHGELDTDAQPKPDDGKQDDPVVNEKDVLVVACWGRFMKEEKFNKLIADFKTYCAQNNIKYTEVKADYYIGSDNSNPYYYIDPFTAAVKATGNTDIILPCADNIKTNQTNVSVLDELIPVTVYGQTNRRVAALNTDELTKAFLTYVQTDSAKTIMSEAD